MNSRQLSVDEARRITGVRLDGRRKWFMWDGEVCFEEKFTRPCSGCSCDTEHPCPCCAEKGLGCQECGYTGKRRDSYPIPHWFSEIQEL